MNDMPPTQTLPPARYVILKDAAGWQINLTGKNYGPYVTQSAAIRDAIDTANKAGEQGYPAQVIIHEDGAFRVHWTYGKDPSPAG